MTASADYEFQSELLRNVVTRGKAQAVLTVPEERGMAVPDDVRDQIQQCVDTDQIDIWLRRAITVTTIADLIRE